MTRLRSAAMLVAVAASLVACTPSGPQVSGSSSTPELAPSVAEGSGGASIADLPDPAWVTRVSADSGVPERALRAYAGADLRMRQESDCAVGWNTLAGIGRIESHHGTIDGGQIDADGRVSDDIVGIALDGTDTAKIADTDDGELDGDADWDRAVGPMQFIPQTWAQWSADGNGDGVEDPQQIDDAALAAARYLCHEREGLENSTTWISAIRSYNDSADYQTQVASAASEYGAYG